MINEHPKTRKFRYEQNPYYAVKAYLPKSIQEELQKRSDALGLPMSRLIAIALDNELDSPVPFTYVCALPASVFIPMAYVEEASKIATFLMKFPTGVGRDQLVLFRRDMGIPNKETFMLAYRELLENGVIEEVNPPKKVKFDYPKGYKYTRLANQESKRKALK